MCAGAVTPWCIFIASRTQSSVELSVLSETTVPVSGARRSVSPGAVAGSVVAGSAVAAEAAEPADAVGPASSPERESARAAARVVRSAARSSKVPVVAVPASPSASTVRCRARVVSTPLNRLWPRARSSRATACSREPPDAVILASSGS